MPYATYRFNKIIAAETIRFIVTVAIVVYKGLKLVVYRMLTILCQFVSSKQRATAYGVMNMVGVFAGAFITNLLGQWGDSGNLGLGFAMLAIVVAVALCAQLYFLRPKTDNVE